MREENVSPEGHRLPPTPEATGLSHGGRRRCEVSGLIKLPIIGDVGFGYQSQNLSIVQSRCTVIQPSVPGKGQTHKGERTRPGCGLRHLDQGSEGFVPQCFLSEKIITAISSEA